MVREKVHYVLKKKSLIFKFFLEIMDHVSFQRKNRTVQFAGWHRVQNPTKTAGLETIEQRRYTTLTNCWGLNLCWLPPTEARSDAFSPSSA